MAIMKFASSVTPEIDSISAHSTSSNSSAYGVGTSGQVLTSNGTKIYWGTPSTVSVVNNLTSTSTTAALSAAQGKALKDDLDGKVSKTGDTITGHLRRKDTRIERGVAPSTDTCINMMTVQDKNTLYMGAVATEKYKSGSVVTKLMVCSPTATASLSDDLADSELGSLGIGFDVNGKLFTMCPTPASTSNSTDIATTEWVKSHLSNYYPVSGGTLSGATCYVNRGTHTGGLFISSDSSKFGLYDSTKQRWLICSESNSDYTDLHWNTRINGYLTAYKDFEYGKTVTENQEGGIAFRDKNGNGLAYYSAFYSTDKVIGSSISVKKDGETAGTIGVRVQNDGTVYTVCPTPADGSNTTHIATTQWVRTHLSKSDHNIGMVTSLIRGTAPSSNTLTQFIIRDKNEKSLGTFYHQYKTDKESSVTMMAYKANASTDSDSAYLRVGFNTSGNVYTYAPTPASTSNTTTIATTAWVRTFHASDIRLKENIEDSKVNALEVLNKFKMKQFDWKGEEAYRGHWDVGVIADEVEKIDSKFVFPDSVDEDGTIHYKSINSWYLEGYMLKAIQELSAELKESKEEIAKLKAKIAD